MRLTVRRRAGATVSFVRAVVREVRTKNVPFMAGSIAYSAFVSLLPLLLLVLLLATAVGGEAIATSMLASTEAYLSPTGEQLLSNAIERAAESTGLSILTGVVLVWGTFRVFRGLDTAFSVLYGTQRKNGLLDQFRDGIVVIGALGVALVAVVAASAVYSLVPALPLARVWKHLFLLAGLPIAFLPLFYVFPDADLTIRESLPGAIVAAVGWTALQLVFGFYVSYSSTSELYGVIGAVVLLITWLYFGALVILIGAATNVVRGGRTTTSATGGATAPE
jgi:membrane protein